MDGKEKEACMLCGKATEKKIRPQLAGFDGKALYIGHDMDRDFASHPLAYLGKGLSVCLECQEAVIGLYLALPDGLYIIKTPDGASVLDIGELKSRKK